MKRFLLIIPALFLAAWLVPAAAAQVAVGVYGDYKQMYQTDTNFAGLGGRVSVHVAPATSLEAQMTYDFEQTFHEGFTNTSGGTLSFSNSGYKVLTGLFGPQFETPGPVHFFVTGKAGFINFSFSPAPASATGFTSTVSNLRDNNIRVLLYPGAGIEGQWGFFGLRLDVGDDIYFSNGARNTLVVQFGPVFHF